MNIDIYKFRWLYIKAEFFINTKYNRSLSLKIGFKPYKVRANTGKIILGMARLDKQAITFNESLIGGAVIYKDKVLSRKHNTFDTVVNVIIHELMHFIRPEIKDHRSSFMLEIRQNINEFTEQINNVNQGV
jgi:hypothetical protein